MQNTELNYFSHLLVKTKIKCCWGFRGESRLTQPRTNEDSWIELSSNRKRAASSLKQMCKDEAFSGFTNFFRTHAVSMVLEWTSGLCLLSLHKLQIMQHRFIYLSFCLVSIVNAFLFVILHLTLSLPALSVFEYICRLCYSAQLKDTRRSKWGAKCTSCLRVDGSK